IHGRVPGEIIDMLKRRVGRRDAPDGGVRIVGDEERPPGQRPSASPGSTTVLEVEVRPGKTEPLEEMLVTAGCRVKRVARTAIGPLRLMGVPPGQWRNLT